MDPMIPRKSGAAAPGVVPVLTEVITPTSDRRYAAPSQGDMKTDLLGTPLEATALEQRLVEAISERLRVTLENRVHASVAPAISLLADRIAYKAAQEVSADLMDRMQEDLQTAVREALEAALRRPV